MARELSQLLLDEGMVTPVGLLRALARQRESGGTLDTALLELGLVPEARLMGALARAADLPAAPLSAYQQLDPRARRVFPSKVAERHGLAPFALDGRELSLVAICPVDLGLLDEVSFMLSLRLSPHVGPEWRVRSLIQRLYGGALSPRLAALAGQAAALGTGPGVEPAADPAPADQAVAPLGPTPVEPAPGVYLGSAMPAVTQAAAPTGAPEPTRPPLGLAGFGREAGEPLEPLSAALAEALELFDVEALEPGPAAPAAPAAGEAGEATRDAPGAGAPGTADLPTTPDRSAPPGWTLAQARAELARASTRDQVVVTTLRYARDFFQFAALFAVARDAVAGHDGLGPDGDARDLVRTVAIYASDPGLFRTTIETMAPSLGRVDRTAPGNQVVLDALGRGSPRTVLVTPILLRARPICLIYADNGSAPVSARRLGDLLAFCSTVGAAFERIIRARKAGPPSGEEVPAASPAAEEPPEPPPLEPPPLEPPPPEPPPPEPPPEPPAPAPQVPEPPRLRPSSLEPVPEAPVQLTGYFEQPEPAWRGPSGPEATVSAAEADFVAAGGQLEPEELFAPTAPAPGPDPEPRPDTTTEVALPEPEPEPDPVRTSDAAPSPGAEPEPEPGPDPDPPPPEPVAAEPAATPADGALASSASEVPAPVPVEAPATEAAPAASDGVPDEPAYLVGAFLSTAPATPVRAELLARLVKHPAAAAILCELLPGPIEVAPEALAATPAAMQGPLFEALSAMGPLAVPPLLALLTDRDPTRRRAAVALLGAIGDPASLVPLADRCLDADPSVAEAARQALAAQRGTPAMRPVPERLRRALASGLAARAGPAARALLALRDVESIPSLIQALEGTDPATAAAAAEALGVITLQRHGTSARSWLLWWKENRGRGRAEWLFGGLTAEDVEVRAAAAAELARIAPPPVDYSPHLTPAEREPVARAWASWFTRSGYRL